jgi:predicted metal-dependent peptidase
MKRTLWATTTTSKNIVPIYLAQAKGYVAFTQSGSPEGTFVVLDPSVVECQDPAYLDETLMHEFIHVCESHFRRELALKNEPNCTQYAQVLGRELPRMLKNLKRV